MSWQEEDPAPGKERNNIRAGTPKGGWTGRRFYLGEKEVLGAKLHAPHHAMETFESRREGGQQYTVFTDLTAAIARARSDNTGPGQRIAIAITEICRERSGQVCGGQRVFARDKFRAHD